MDKLLPIKEVEAICGMKRRAIYKRVEDGTFPSPLKPGKTTSLWKESEIQKWINSLPRATYQDKE